MKQAYISIIFIHHKEAVKNYLLNRKTEILQNLDITLCHKPSILRNTYIPFKCSFVSHCKFSILFIRLSSFVMFLTNSFHHFINILYFICQHNQILLLESYHRLETPILLLASARKTGGFWAKNSREKATTFTEYLQKISKTKESNTLANSTITNLLAETTPEHS